jgi:hypothetical protein
MIMRASMEEFKTVSVTTRVEDVHSTETDATAIVLETFKGTTFHHIGDDDRMSADIRAKQTWTKTPNGWLLRKVDVLATTSRPN